MNKPTAQELMYQALRVIAETPAIRRALAVTDMKALIQVDTAINAADMNGHGIKSCTWCRNTFCAPGTLCGRCKEGKASNDVIEYDNRNTDG